MRAAGKTARIIPRTARDYFNSNRGAAGNRRMPAGGAGPDETGRSGGRHALEDGFRTRPEQKQLLPSLPAERRGRDRAARVH